MTDGIETQAEQREDMVTEQPFNKEEKEIHIVIDKVFSSFSTSTGAHLRMHITL